MGLSIDAYSSEGLIDRLISDSLNGVGGYVMTPNLDNLRALTHDPALMDRAKSADIRVADGMPLLWASRLQRTALPSRVPGSDLILTLSQAAAKAGRSVYLLGGEPGTADDAAAELRLRFVGLRIAGTDCPPFGFENDPELMEAMRARLRDASPDFVYIGLPFPKASALANDLRHVLPHAWFLGIGVSFSFVCGDVVRAPRWMQRLGLEWIHRLQQEPRRLARRYLLEGLPFALRLFGASLAKRWASQPTASQAGLR